MWDGAELMGSHNVGEYNWFALRLTPDTYACVLDGQSQAGTTEINSFSL